MELIATEAGAPAKAPQAGPPARLVVRSIGSASFSIVAALRQISARSEQDLAERLFRAPSELFAAMPRETAEKAAEVLRKAGLEVDVLAEGDAFTPGEGLFDVALLPADYARMTEAARELTRLLGVDAKTARQMVCASPVILVGAVSSATVDAIRRRFAPLGVELLVSQPTASTFDVIVGDCAPMVRARLLATLESSGFASSQLAGGGAATGAADRTSGAGAPDARIIAAGLDKAAAERVWEQFGRKNPALRILDRAFERFDIRLDACPRAAVPGLVALAGMPEKVALKVIERLPVVIQQGLTYDEARESLARLGALGAKAASELQSLQAFSAVIEAAADRPKAAQRLRALMDLTEEQAEALLRSLPARIEGPLTLPHARWLQAELKAVGASVKLVRR